MDHLYQRGLTCGDHG